MEQSRHSAMALAALAVGLAALAAKQPDDPGCQFKWTSLGCVPSASCKLLWKPTLGTFGPCVLRKPPTTPVEKVAPEEVQHALQQWNRFQRGKYEASEVTDKANVIAVIRDLGSRGKPTLLGPSLEPLLAPFVGRLW